MKIINIRAFEGRNYYSHKKCIRMDLDLEGYCETPSKNIENFNLKLIRLLPELNKHRCGIDEPAGFIKRLQEGTYLAHICEHMIIAIQNLLGIDVSYGKAREIAGDRYYIIYQYEYKETAISVGKLAVDIINALIYKRNINFDERIRSIKELLNEEYIGPSTNAVCEEAKKLGIPVMKIGDTGLYQLGYGKYSRLIEATICEDTGAIGVDISCDKMMTKSILEMQCLPVARGVKVSSPMELLRAGESIGYPLVLKPQCGHQGQGVHVNLRTEKDALKVYAKLSKQYKDIIVEKYIEGNDYRVCVIDGEVVAVALRLPPFVVGDGMRTIRQLIDDLNRDPRRGLGHEKPLTRVKIDDILVSEINKQGYELEDIPENGIRIVLRENANLSTGGIAIDYTDKISEENIDICKRAAKAIGLNICGIDISCKNIGESLYNQGAIVEINSAPGIRMHHFPYEGESRNVAKAIVEMMFKDMPKSIPIVAITGTNGKTTTTRLIGYTLGLAGYSVGMTTTGGIYVNNKCIAKGDTTGPESAISILTNKDIDIAVLETARGGIVRGGLAYDVADVGLVTNITEDHLGIDGIKTIDDLAKVKSLVVEAIKEDGYAVINADDPVSKTIIHRIKSKIVMFSKDKNNKMLRENIEKGGIGIYIDGGYIWSEDESSIYNIIATNEIGITLGGKLLYNIENSMAACAALVGLGIDYLTISKGLSTFYCNEENNPGRFNVYDLNGVTVVLDYGHNIEGYKAVLEGIKHLKYSRAVGVIGVPGDRLNSNIIDIGAISGKYFDYIYIKEDQDKRGRRRGEVADLLETGVVSSGFSKKNLDIILDEKNALIKALDNAKFGDLIVVFFEDYESLNKIVKSRIESIKNIIAQEVMA